jgi:HEPN domain-containing protein
MMIMKGEAPIKKSLEIDLVDKLSLRILLIRNTKTKPDEHLFDVLLKVIRSDESVKIKLMKLLN